MDSTPRLQPHQQATLREELSKPEYAAMPVEEAYLTVAHGLVAKRLARTVYRDEGGKVLKGLPGFPNKVRRADFDLVWRELRGTA